jgi:excinuclease ABC subunit C
VPALAPERLAEILDHLPREPGVYLMKDRAGKVFYVGKASNLRSRVRSYFNRSGDTRAFVALLDRLLADLEVLVTRNEKEALLLENNLIKQHRPRYNVLLRDDKTYLALRLDPRAAWPRLELVRGVQADGARYFGPYHSARAARRTTRLLNRRFKLRICTDRVLGSRTRPCLQHQIGRCLAPCCLPVDPVDYAQRVADVTLFLSGRQDELIRQVEARMEAAAAAEAYEQAAELRDLAADLRSVTAEQHVVEAVGFDQDVIGLHREGDRVWVCVLLVRRGRLVGSEDLALTHQEFPDEEMVSSLLTLRYEGAGPFPDEILVPCALDDSAVLEDWLHDQAGRRVRVLHPQRGYRRQLLEMAERNASNAAASRASGTDDALGRLERLQRRLRLGRLPRRIEACDISTLQGQQTVGSLVVMVDAEPAPAEYRHYRIRSATQPDDFAALQELLGRRFERARRQDPGWAPPDLLVIDGGKGQLGVALAVLAELGMSPPPFDVVALAKARPTLAGDAMAAAEPAPDAVVDRVFLPGVKDPVRLRPNTNELFLLSRLRDEAHRFAIGHHRRLRRAAALRSGLEDVPGVGPRRAAALLRHFGSLRSIRAATVDEIARAPLMNATVAEALARHLGADAADAGPGEVPQEPGPT